jgi:hypothetical protein
MSITFGDGNKEQRKLNSSIHKHVNASLDFFHMLGKEDEICAPTALPSTIDDVDESGAMSPKPGAQQAHR